MTTRSNSKSPTCAPRESPPRTRRPRADASARKAPHFLWDLTSYLDVVFHAVEGARHYPDSAGGVPVRGAKFLPGSHRQRLAALGAAPSRARPRPAGRLLPAARGGLQLREEGKARPGAR